MPKERRFIDTRYLCDLARRGGALTFPSDDLAGGMKNPLSRRVGSGCAPLFRSGRNVRAHFAPVKTESAIGTFI